MELKERKRKKAKSKPKFQSHLYGIESFLINTVRICLMSFNRTFMELKAILRSSVSCRFAVSIAPLWNWKRQCSMTICGTTRRFQSHLYGIESNSQIRGQHRERNVSIAPLWNWKWLWLWSMGCRRLFQSHLYGIERRKNFKILIEYLCFNRTFMELKATYFQVADGKVSFQSHLYGIERWAERLVRGKTLSFNRTFMELKVMRSTASMCFFVVSIAPLWNWKRTRRKRRR